MASACRPRCCKPDEPEERRTLPRNKHIERTGSPSWANFGSVPLTNGDLWRQEPGCERCLTFSHLLHERLDVEAAIIDRARAVTLLGQTLSNIVRKRQRLGTSAMVWKYNRLRLREGAGVC
eukprot:GHVU01129796.1.p1 GENE.GHVU01129796.1~~GHVU01129796.1.p1  ORF type:complete len:121 (+),score=6.17 GHVU01129796.1:385-747(+)